jgi:hypothetical protein
MPAPTPFMKVGASEKVIARPEAGVTGQLNDIWNGIILSDLKQHNESAS